MIPFNVFHGECLKVLRLIPDNSIDAIVTDPPAGIGFMNKKWDKDKGGRDKWVAWLSERLQECLRVLKPGGMLYVRTPAFQALYGGHDVTLHTRHRYTGVELANKLGLAGLEVLQTTYANTILFPIAAARRMLAKLTHSEGESDVRAVPGPLNAALTAIFSLEASILPRTSLPFGLSAIAIARKP